MKVTCSININSEPEKVWYWLATPERAMSWQTGVSGTELLERTPGVVGTTFRETIEQEGHTMEMYGIVADYQENQLLVMHLSSEYNTVEVEWRIEKAGEHTRLTVDSDIRFLSLVKVISFLMMPVFKKRILRQLQGELVRLKQLCERDS